MISHDTHVSHINLTVLGIIETTSPCERLKQKIKIRISDSEPALQDTIQEQIQIYIVQVLVFQKFWPKTYAKLALPTRRLFDQRFRSLLNEKFW